MSADPQSILRTVTRVIEAELKPDAVVILVRLNDENHMQPAGDSIQWPVLVLSAAARCAGMLTDELKETNKQDSQPQKEETK